MFEKAQELIAKSNSIYIVGHENPDGDTIGSTISLKLALNSIGKKADVIMSNCSEHFSFLEELKNVKQNIDENEYDLLICVDSSDRTRLDITEKDYNKANKTLQIDHHVKKDGYADIELVNSSSPATCELIYELLDCMNIKITKEIAKYIYVGLITDTGSFNYSCTTSKTMRIAANLIDTGIDFSDICMRLNDTMNEGKLLLIAKTIDSMEKYFNGMIRYSYIKQDILSKLNLDDTESEGMSNYLRMAEGTELAIYVREEQNGTNKVSLRSKGIINSAQIAMQFGGGGHARAAGYTMNKDYETSKKELLEYIGVMLNANE